MISMTVNSPLRIESKKFLKLAILLASAQVAQSMTGFFDTIGYFLGFHFGLGGTGL